MNSMFELHDAFNQRFDDEKGKEGNAFEKVVDGNHPWKSTLSVRRFFVFFLMRF